MCNCTFASSTRRRRKLVSGARPAGRAALLRTGTRVVLAPRRWHPSSFAFYRLRDDRILQVICPTCQVEFVESEVVAATAGYFAWGCFRYFGCECRADHCGAAEQSAMCVLARDTAARSTVIVRESGRSSIPETLAMKWIGRGVLDPPHARGMTAVIGRERDRLFACYWNRQSATNTKNARHEAGHDQRDVIPGREANPESGDCCARFRVRARARPGMTMQTSIPIMIRLERAKIVRLARTPRHLPDADPRRGRYCPFFFVAMA